MVAKAQKGGQTRFGPYWAAAEGIFGREFQTLVNLANVSRSFQTNRRRLVLSFTHHAEVAGLPPVEADDLRLKLRGAAMFCRIEHLKVTGAGKFQADPILRYSTTGADDGSPVYPSSSSFFRI